MPRPSRKDNMKNYPHVTDKVLITTCDPYNGDFAIETGRVISAILDNRRADQQYVFAVEAQGKIYYRYKDEIYESMDEIKATLENHLIA